MHTRMSWGSHITAALSSTIVSQAFAAGVQIIIVRALSSSGYGTYTTLYAWLAIASSIIGAGFDTWLLDRGSRQPTHLRHHLHHILRIKLGLWSIIIPFFVWQIDQISITLLSVGLIVIFIDSIGTTMLQALRALNQHRTVALLQLISPGILLVVVSLWQSNQIIWILTAQLIGIGLVSIAAWYSLMPHLSTSVTDTPTTLITSWPFIISDILAQIYTYTSTLLLASYASTTDVGIFRGAWSFIAYTVVIPSMIFSTTLPLLNHADDSQQLSIIQRSALAFFLYALGVGGFIAFGGGQIIVWLYGESFAPSIEFITHLTLLPLIKACTFFGVMLLIHRQRLIWRITTQLITVSVLWLWMPSLIAQFGISGAIQAQLIAESVLACGYLIGGLWVTRRIIAPAHTWPPKRIIITNMHGTRNLGDAAIHQIQQLWLLRQFPSANIHHCYAVAPNTTTRSGISHWVYDTHGNIAPWPTRLRRMLALIWCLTMHTIGISSRWGMTPIEQQAITTIITADLVCASGGGYLFDTPSTHPWWRFISWDWWLCADMLVACVWRRPLVLLPQSIGPLHNWPFRTFVRWILQHAHMIYLRESYSTTVLDSLGISYQRAPDFVWAMPIIQHTTPPIVPTLGITVMNWGKQSGFVSQQHTYEATLITVATTLHQHGWNIQLIGQATDHTPGWDDTEIVHRLAMHLPFATVIPPMATPDELQHHVAQLTCLVSTRLHGALLRFAMGQSAVVIAYHPKAHGMMHDIGLTPWCIPIDTITTDAVLDAIHTHTTQLPLIQQQRAHLRAQLDTLAIPPTTTYPTHAVIAPES